METCRRGITARLVSPILLLILMFGLLELLLHLSVRLFATRSFQPAQACSAL
jgi:hypothetical protein